MVKLIKQPRKSPMLKVPAFGCLSGTPAINITRGCLHGCVYCYARGFPEAPPRGEIHLYQNLPKFLEKELERKRSWPRWVAFSTASDAFQGLDEVLTITYRVMAILLKRGIGVSFLTKGHVPSEFLDLFRRYPGKVSARIGLASLSQEYRRLFEPRAASPSKRLANLRNLSDAGVRVAVRLDPLIHRVTDGEESLEHLCLRLKVHGVKEMAVSYLVLRPAVMKEFVENLPSRLTADLFEPYQGQPWQQVIASARTQLLPRELRQGRYSMIKKIAARFSLRSHICGCKNPDLEWESCHPWEAAPDTTRILPTAARQINLF